MTIRLARVVLRCLPILLFSVCLPAPYGLRLPPTLSSALLFPISMILGFLVLIAFSMLVYISAFYTISPMGVRILVTSVMEFFAGALIPIPFFPSWLQKIMYALPFSSMQSTPFLIYTGHLHAVEALQRIGTQLLWLAGLLMIGRFWIKQALKKVVVQGG